MNSSSIVQSLLEIYKSNPPKVYEGETRSIGEPDQRQVQKALIKICDAWLKGEKSKSFIKHLLDTFIPLSTSSTLMPKVEDNTRCCILGIKMAGTEDIKAIKPEIFKWLNLEGKVIRESRDIPRDIKKELFTLKRNLPIEVKTATTAYSSPRSSKYISVHVAAALEIFVKDNLEKGNKEVKAVLENQKRKRSVPKKKGNTMDGFIDPEVLEKLKKIRG